MLGFFMRVMVRTEASARLLARQSRAEAILLIGTAVILTVLVFMGQRVWASSISPVRLRMRSWCRSPVRPVRLEIHYPGPDVLLGERTPA